MVANAKRKKNANPNAWMSFLSYLHNRITTVNQSKIFAGIIIIVLNISSKFVTIHLGKTMEAYLKYTFSRNVLIFAMAWMGTRDIYVALFITLLFIFLMDYLFNESSRLCCLPNNFMKYHEGLQQNEESQQVSQKQIADAISTLTKLNESMDKSKDPTSTNPPLSLTSASSLSSDNVGASYTPMVG